MIFIKILIALIGYVLIFYQARGRQESLLLWSLIYIIPVSLICLIPNFHVVLVLVNVLTFGLIALMGPWKRKIIVVVDPHGREPSRVKEDYTNLIGVADNEDIKVLDTTKLLDDPLAIKHYNSHTGQQELWGDLAKLKKSKIPYEVKTGILTTLFVNANSADQACNLLGIITETTDGPSNN